MIVAIDLGGTSVRLATFDGEVFSEVERHRTPTVFDGAGAADVWESIASIAGSYLTRVRLRSHIERVAVSFPGPVDASGSPICAPTVEGNERYGAIRETFQRSIGAELVFLNDVSAAAWHLSTIVPFERFAVVTVSSGIGSKLFMRGIGVIDDCAFAGEIGHVVVDATQSAPPCDCGGRGHLGAIASGRGYERHARLAARGDHNAFRRSMAARHGTPPELLTNERDLVPALHLGDEWAWAVLRDGIDALARILAPAIHVAGLQNVTIIGGFAAALGDRYAVELRTALARYIPERTFHVPLDGMISVVPLEEHACLRGAVEYARRAVTPVS